MKKSTKTTTKTSQTKLLKRPTVKTTKRPTAKLRSSKSSVKSKSKVRKSKARAKKLDMSYLVKIFSVSAAAIAVIVGAQFIDVNDDAGQVNGATDVKGAIYMVVPSDIKLGEVVNAELWSDSTEQVNAAQASVVYPDQLQYVAVDDATSSYDVDPPITAKDNKVIVPKGTMSPLVGKQKIGIIQFKAVGAGAAQLAFDDKDTKLLTSDGNDNIVAKTSNYVINITE